MTRIKGTALRGTLKFVKAHPGAGSVDEVLGALPDPVRGVFEHPILSSSWYPYPAYAELLVAVDRILGRGELSLMPELGLYQARQDVGSTFKIVSAFASVRTVIQRSMLFWNRHCDTGAFEAVDAGEDWALGRLSGFPGISVAHCHLLRGWIEGIGLGAGAQRVDVRQVKCVHHGDACCEYRGAWR